MIVAKLITNKKRLPSVLKNQVLLHFYFNIVRGCKEKTPQAGNFRLSIKSIKDASVNGTFILKDSQLTNLCKITYKERIDKKIL